MPTPTSPENIKRINDMFNNVSDLVERLAARWQDEKEYEDIITYKDVIQRQIPKEFVIAAMTKKPFGFQFTIGTDAVYSVYCNRRNVGWNRIR
jgi:uncharacterized protein YaaR (DUF327 family)